MQAMFFRFELLKGKNNNNNNNNKKKESKTETNCDKNEAPIDSDLIAFIYLFRRIARASN